MDDDEGLAFIKFFSTLTENLDETAAAVVEKEGTILTPDLLEPVHLLQEYVLGCSINDVDNFK